jgi:hypothetical protein
VVCGTNLSGITKAMVVYANDDETARFPRAGGVGSVWAGGVDMTTAPPTATASASLYLLVKGDFTTPKQFICRSDAGATEFRDPDLTALWDFGNPTENNSYSYHVPYSFDLGGGTMASYGLTGASDPGMAVVADRNSWMTAGFDPVDPDVDVTKHGNCSPHQRDGQNVAYVDTHVKFEKSPSVGLNQDNIYLVADDPDPGSLVSSLPAYALGPVDRRDSVLVNEPQ